MVRLKDIIMSVAAIPFVLFAAFVINMCDCESSIADDLPPDFFRKAISDFSESN